LNADYKDKLIELLNEYVDYFPWSYSEMPGLSHELVEHRLSIKDGFRPYKQPARRFNPDIYDHVKEEINQLLEANFIWLCRYTDWISNIVPVEKKGTGNIRICINFHNLNRATPKDEYPMPIADMLVSDSSGHKIISFLDGNAKYNQIIMAEEDMYKMTFWCPDFVGLFEWVVMTFGLKNARAINLIFHDLLGIIVEVYIDDIVVKSVGLDSHLANLHHSFERICHFGLKMNPLKCAFGVSSDNFLGFIIYENGIEIDPKKIEVIQKVQAPTWKRDVEKFIDKVNFLLWFIVNLSGKLIPFTRILQLKDEAKFT
jgi:hypothetical protein